MIVHKNMKPRYKIQEILENRAEQYLFLELNTRANVIKSLIFQIVSHVQVTIVTTINKFMPRL